jgi:protein SCO1/2
MLRSRATEVRRRWWQTAPYRTAYKLEFPMASKWARLWWLLGVPVGVAAGGLLAVWLRTSGEEALTLRRGEQVDLGFLDRRDPDAAVAVAPLAAMPVGGRVLLLTFGYASCPDVCPTTLMAVHTALQRLGSSATQVLPVFVTVDPARDTAQRLQQYVYGFDPRIRSISDPATVAAAQRAFHVRAANRPPPSGTAYAVDHTAVLYVLDRDRRVVAALPEASAGFQESLIAALNGLVAPPPGDNAAR